MPEPREHAEHRNWVETILRHVPGFSGYLEKEYRRESDELQRTWLADRLSRSKRGLEKYTRFLVDGAQIDQLPQCDRARGHLDKLLGRIQGAMQGYSGIFDLVRIDKAVLDRVYAHDVSLMEGVVALAERIEGLGPSSDPPEIVVPEILDRIEQIESSWDDREDILKGLE